MVGTDAGTNANTTKLASRSLFFPSTLMALRRKVGMRYTITDGKLLDRQES